MPLQSGVTSTATVDQAKIAHEKATIDSFYLSEMSVDKAVESTPAWTPHVI